MSFSIEQASIILETISFFLVTIDLLGRERITLLQSQFEKRIGTARSGGMKGIDLLLMGSGEVDGWMGCFGTVIFAVAMPGGCFLTLASLAVMESLLSYLDMPSLMLLALLLSVFTWGFFVALIFQLLTYVGALITWLIKIIVNGMFGLILYLFDRMKLKGVMLVTGALLFFLSKALAYINAGSK